MSINVTVSGNPVSIHRGKMVTTSDTYQCKKDFEKRRLMRIQQVRQQSKDIAEDVRNRVKREKQKQIGDIEKEGKEKLKNWQNRKLLELQSQYKEALVEVGMGHKEAENIILEEEEDELEKLKNDEKAKEREEMARAKILEEKAQKKAKEQKKKEHKKLVRDIEDTRSALVTKIKKISPRKTNSNKKKPSANINISIPDSSNNTECDENVEFTEVSEGPFENTPESSCTCDEKLSSVSSSDKEEPVKKVIEDLRRPLTVLEEPVGQAKPNFVIDASSQTNKDLNKKKETAKSTTLTDRRPGSYYDSRISDRIKRREVMASQPDYCEQVAEVNPNPLLKSNTEIRDAIYSRNLDENKKKQKICDCGNSYTQCDCCCGMKYRDRTKKSDYVQTNISDFKINSSVTNKSSGQTEIPQKPKIKLKNATEKSSSTNMDYPKASSASMDSNKVSYYEHRNKYEGQMRSGTSVEKILLGDVEIEDNLSSERDYYDKMRQRDREALMRGKKALEKEKIQRDYKEMMQKLPILQKQDRLSKLHTDRPEYHMSEERRQELERKKQNQMENAYVKLFPNLEPKIVTLPSNNQKEPSNEVFKVLDKDSPDAKQIGSWDVDYKSPKLFTADEVQNIVKAFTEPTHQDRKSKFKELLSSLKMQKKQLLEEIKNLPRDESVIQMMKDLKDFDDSDVAPKRKPKIRRKESASDGNRRRVDELSTVSEESELEKRPKMESKDRRHAPIKRRKSSTKQKVLILQNMSTQTTPKPVTDKITDTNENEVVESKSSGEEAVPKKVSKTVKDVICKKTHKPCDCLKSDDGNDKFEIVIKINDDKPEVIIKDRGQKTEPVMKTSIKEPVTVASSRDGKSTTKTEKPPKPSDKIPKPPEKPLPKRNIGKDKSLTWKEHFSKNNSTSSTSYMSPPDLSAGTIDSFYNLHKKPQQKNILQSNTSPSSVSGEEITDPNLILCITKLLSMPRQTVDALGVSSSSVSTPNQSVVEMDSNVPPNPMHGILKFFTKYLPDAKKNLSFSQDDECSPCSNLNVSCDVPICPKSQTQQQAKPDKKSAFETPVNQYESYAKQYAAITDSTSKKIEHLAAMIQKLREEKNKIMEKSASSTKSEDKTKTPEKDETDYLEVNHSSKGSSSTPTAHEDDLNNKLLEIDINLGNKLRKFRSEENDPPDEPESDEMLTKRLLNLINDTPDAPAGNQDPFFVPLLSDIPKLPKFQLCESICSENGRTKPPTSKGLTFARRFNDISLVPHELSAIQETESQVSTKLDTSRNSGKTKEFDSHDTVATPAIPEKLDNFPVNEVDTLKCDPNYVLQVCKEKSFCTVASSSSDDIESIESMLKNIGMEWAIPTLHKTKQALALSSSTSSDSTSKLGDDSKLEKDVSAIQSNSDSREKNKNQRTSTPVQIKSSFLHRNISQEAYSDMCTKAAKWRDKSKLKSCSAISNSSSSLPKEILDKDDFFNCDSYCNHKACKEKSIEIMLENIGMGWALPMLCNTKKALALSSSTSTDSSVELGMNRVEKDSFAVPAVMQLWSHRTSTPVQDNCRSKDSFKQAFSGQSDFSDVNSTSENKSSSDKSLRKGCSSKSSYESFHN